MPPKGHATAEEGQAETWNCEHGVHKLENIIHGIIFFAGTGSDITIHQFEGQGDMANMSSYLSVLLQCCCIDVNL